jgi:hypothetical protein
MQAHSERQATDDDGQYIYKLSEITMGCYVEATWGIWDDEWQLARLYIIPEYQFRGID